MSLSDVEAVFVAMLGEAGLAIRPGIDLKGTRLGAAAPAVAWSVFKSFASISVEDRAVADDRLQFETGVYEFGRELGGRRFWFGPRRQFTLYEADEYDRTEILHCDFLFPVVPALEALPAEFFSTADVSVESFVRLVEGSESYRGTLTSGVAPNGLWLKLEPV